MTEYKSKRRIYLVVGLVGAALAGYVLFQSRNLILGPSLTVSEPRDGARLESSFVTVRGKARNIAYIKLNDRQIFVDDLGLFEEKLIAPEGYTIMKFAAEDRFGRVVEKYLHFVYLPERGWSKAPSSAAEEKVTDQNNNEEKQI
ncbi:hypothetical protein EPN83_00875 [Patescibacteria group bacterium]|nr:MAG: hypothetical protein EPN83_00875 [Patescibacteria group bacterium]